MKRTFILSLICVAIAIASFITPPNALVGRWQSKGSDGSTALTVFRANGTYDIFINGKAFVNGKYYVRQDTFGIEDASCGAGYYGTYILDFSVKDSVRFIAIQDACNGRKEDVIRTTMGRVKPAKL